MIRCESCFAEYEEEKAFGVCPYCGYYDGYEPEDPRFLPIGTLLQNRYVIGGVIGVGGFGITYKAWDIQLKVCKAIKEYFQQGVVNRIPGTTEVLISNPKRREEFEYGKQRLLDEAEIVAKFQSPGIVRVDTYFAENNTAYMVMEYLKSKTLEDYIISRNQLLEVDEAVKIAIHICEALKEIHAAGVIHRDISPDNIHADEQGNVKIIDFGSARLSKEDTDDRLIMIKPGFAPPEQYEKIDLKDDRQGPWTDIYALGATLYTVLTGNIPEEASDRKANLDNGIDNVCYPNKINPVIPDYLSNAIMTAMAVYSHERFQNTDEFIKVLKKERKILPVEVVRKRKKMRRTAGIGGGFAVAAMLLGVFGYRLWLQRQEVVLEKADISLWYSVNEENEATKNAAIEAIVGDISASNVFQNVTIDVQSIPEDEYEAVLETAYTDGNMPTVFESFDSEKIYMQDACDLRDIVKTESDTCYFLEDFSEYFEDFNQMPTGFNIPVIYLNTSIVQDYTDDMKISSMKDMMLLCNGDMKYKPMALNPELADVYGSMFEDFEKYENKMTKKNAKELFIEGKQAVYFSNTADYLDIHASLSASYVMIPVETKDIICNFINYWSISNCSEAEYDAAAEILKMFLSDNAQDKFYLNNANTGLPINKKLISDYIDVRYRFEEILQDCSKYTFGEQ